MPAKFLDNPNWKINMSTTDYKLLQQANTDQKAGTTGFLTQNNENTYQGKEIVHYSGLTAGSIVGAEGMTVENSNLVFGFWIMPQNEIESARIMRVSNVSEEWFMRINFKLGAQYRNGSDIVLYQPA